MITVADKNEHAPQFTSSAYFGQILVGNPDSQLGANETSNRVILRVGATDQDHGENARIFYSIKSGKNNFSTEMAFCLLHKNVLFYVNFPL